MFIVHFLYLVCFFIVEYFPVQLFLGPGVQSVDDTGSDSVASEGSNNIKSSATPCL